ncbi:hypothetical protein DVH24_010251 [Malus domestica]|uniref:Uncharacterized protein n=1 Tax=Malus domestica TaxID=3750 RepID=A0A498JSA5_MALDO|nr:hypothetical protein DVH24_010251 [Malus domestica]
MTDNKLLTLGLLEKSNFLHYLVLFIFGCSVFAFKWLSSSPFFLWNSRSHWFLQLLSLKRRNVIGGVKYWRDN